MLHQIRYISRKFLCRTQKNGIITVVGFFEPNQVAADLNQCIFIFRRLLFPLAAFRVGELCDSELKSNLRNEGGGKKTKMVDEDRDDNYDGDYDGEMPSRDAHLTSRGASVQSVNAASNTDSRKSLTHLKIDDGKHYEDEREYRAITVRRLSV